MSRFRRLEGEGGFTLVELMVVLVLTGIVLGIAVNALIQAQRTMTGTLQRQNDLGQARIAADAVSADLRTLTVFGGVVFETASASEVIFYAARDITCATPSASATASPPACGAPARIRIVREANGDLVRYLVRLPLSDGRTPARTRYDAVAPQRRVLARGLLATPPLFRYHSTYAYAGTPTATPVASEVPLTAPSGGTPTVPADQRDEVRFVELTLVVDPADQRAIGPTPLRSVVRLVNVG
jgi:prepilin-type N-terminal cleavage/methylation domain-containing protein